MKPNQSLGDLRQFTGTEQWYRHALNGTVLYTDGAKHVAETAGAHWLLDEIALAQRFTLAVHAEAFQLWRLFVREGASALLVCEDGDGRRVYAMAIPVTGFPPPGIELFCCDGTIMLPGEY